MRPNGTNNLLQMAARVTRGAESHLHDIAAAGRYASDLRQQMDRLQQTATALASAQTTRILSIKRLALADKVLRTWLAKARLVVLLARTCRSSESWSHTGFKDRRTRVPRRLDDRIALARALVSFFARHPQYGVAFAEITAARGRAIYERVVQSGEMLLLAKNDCAVARQQREAAEAALRATLRDMISELKAQLQPCDACWTDFGLTPKSVPKGGLGRFPLRTAAPIPFIPQSTLGRHSVAA